MSELDVEEHYESDSSENEEKHLNLLNSVSQLDSAQRVKAAQRNEIATEVSEFNLNKGLSQKQNLVNVDDLINVLGNKSSHSVISKKVKNVTKQSKTLPKPLEKIVEERLKRSIGFDNVKQQLRKWDAIVTRNALRDKIVFPLDSGSVKMEKSNDFLSQFQKPTELEQEMAKVLQEDIVKEKEEEEDTYPLTYEEMMEKRREMAQLRAKLSYRQMKAQRQNKIKSKKYHRLLKREKIRQQIKEFEMLQKTDPEAALQKLSELDKTRAKERATLRHRNTGNWAKSLTVKAKYDIETRKILAEQLKLSKELTQKVSRGDSSDDDDNEPEEPIPIPTTPKETKTESSNNKNPWTLDVSKEVEDFISGYKKFWLEKENEKNSKKESKAVVTDKMAGVEKDESEKEQTVDDFDWGVDENVEAELIETDVTQSKAVAKENGVSLTDKKVNGIVGAEKTQQTKQNGSPQLKIGKKEQPKQTENDLGLNGNVESETTGKTKQNCSPQLKVGKTEQSKPREKGVGSEKTQKIKQNGSPESKVGKKEQSKQTENDLGLNGNVESEMTGKTKQNGSPQSRREKKEQSKPKEKDLSLNGSEKTKRIKQNGSPQSKTKQKDAKANGTEPEKTQNAEDNNSTTPKIKRGKNYIKKMRRKGLIADKKPQNNSKSKKTKTTMNDPKPSIAIYPTSGLWLVTPVEKESTPNKKRKAEDLDTLFEDLNDELADKAEKKVKKIEKKLKKTEKKKLKKESKKESEEIDLSFKNAPKIVEADEDGGLLEGGVENDVRVNSVVEQKKEVAEIDPKNFIQIKPKKILSNLPENITGDDDDEETIQRKLVEEAFGNDDVVAEFREKKKEEEGKSKVEIDLSLPGWGQWGGVGIAPKRRKKKRLIINLPPRKDKHKKDVIINENENPNLKNHLVKEVPHPFKSVEAFEATIRAPIGRDWVPETAHRKLIEKQIQTKLGAIIEPMNENQIIKLGKTPKSPYQGMKKKVKQ